MLYVKFSYHGSFSAILPIEQMQGFMHFYAIVVEAQISALPRSRQRYKTGVVQFAEHEQNFFTSGLSLALDEEFVGDFVGNLFFLFPLVQDLDEVAVGGVHLEWFGVLVDEVADGLHAEGVAS
jgi:hypothetical protein